MITGSDDGAAPGYGRLRASHADREHVINTGKACCPGFSFRLSAEGEQWGHFRVLQPICQAESLARYARHADSAPPKGDLRAWDKRRQAR